MVVKLCRIQVLCCTSQNNPTLSLGTCSDSGLELKRSWKAYAFLLCPLPAAAIDYLLHIFVEEELKLSSYNELKKENHVSIVK